MFQIDHFTPINQEGKPFMVADGIFLQRLIDDARIYNRALASTEVAKNEKHTFKLQRRHRQLQLRNRFRIRYSHNFRDLRF